MIVQRTLGAKNNIHAKAGSIFAGFLKTLPIFIMVMPGMISRVLFPNSIACADPDSCEHYCDNKWGCFNNAYPKWVLNLQEFKKSYTPLTNQVWGLTVSYTDQFFPPSIALGKWKKKKKKQGSITYSTDREIKVSKVFVICTVCVWLVLKMISILTEWLQIFFSPWKQNEPLWNRF